MTRLFWKNHRLPWPLLTAVVLTTSSAMGLDYCWRIFTIPFWLLAAGAIAYVALGICALIAGAVSIHRKEDLSSAKSRIPTESRVG